jgi:hypothetical protein
MEGTHMPTKIPCSCEPLNQRYTDNKNDNPAAAKMEALAIRILELMSLHSFRVPIIDPAILTRDQLGAIMIHHQAAEDTVVFERVVASQAL